MKNEQKDLFEGFRFVIAMGYHEDVLEARAKEEGLVPFIVRFSLPFEAMKAILGDFTTMSNTSDVILVDTVGATDKKFSPFMKLMENVNSFFGRIWFYNSAVSIYPLTIVSRCSVMVNPDMPNEAERFLEEAKESKDYLKDMLRLNHYRYDVALRMLKAKESFVSFLLGLQNMTYKDYHLLTVNEDKAEEFLYLLYEWLMESPIFTTKELQHCKQLRDFKFQKLLGKLGVDKSIEKYIIPFVISYQMTKK